jgi:flagellar basal-body rod modification protein FlgD
MGNTITTPAAGTPPAFNNSTSLAPTTASAKQKTQFLNLLVAQLKGQNPLDPKDGSEFVAQLAQFSSLEELINIRTLLESVSKPSTATNPNSPTAPTTPSNPFQGV